MTLLFGAVLFENKSAKISIPTAVPYLVNIFCLKVRQCPVKTKVGLKQYHSLDIGLGLWRWAFCRIFNSPTSHIEHNSVSGSVQRNQQAISVTIGEARRIDVRASPILSFPLCCANTIVAAIRTQPVGEAQRIKKNSTKTSHWGCEFVAFRLCAAKAPSFALKRRE